MINLPANWTIAGIEEALLAFENGQTLRQGWSPQCERFPAETENDWGVLKTTAIQDGEFQPEHNKRLPSALEPDPLLEVQEGDLLLTCAGPRVRCGVICLVRETRRRLMVSGKMYRFRSDPRIALATYLEAFLRSHDTKKRIDEMKTGISDSGLNLTLSRFKTLQVPLPPLPEQRRIVAKIEELFSELDEGVENLKHARAQLAVYRQALLKHAFEGKLTADWRAAHADQLESADQLLSRIRAEREARSHPVTAAEIDSLPALPSGWIYARFGTFIASIDAGKSFRCQERTPRPKEVGVAKVSAVSWGEYQESESKTCIDQSLIKPAYFIREGDFLLSRANTIDLVGACVIVKKVTQQIMLSDKTLRLSLRDLPQGYFLHFLRSRQGRRQIMDHSTGNQESMRNIGQERIRSIVVPVCSADEASMIFDQVETQLATVSILESDIEANLQKAEALRQSILKKAFAGELVPQDPADEPAATQLARIRAERAATTPVKIGKRRTKTAATA